MRAFGRPRVRVRLAGWVATFLALAGPLPLAAQDVAAQLTGRLDSRWVWAADPAPGQGLGLTTGWAGITGGTRDVKTEVRLGLGTAPTPAVTLNRAWTKFRVPGWRFTAGLGRLAWGTGFVLVPGDLLFDSTGTAVDFGAEELRSSGGWVGDLWASLGDEAFAEAAVLADQAGLRVSAAPGGVTLEASAAWDRQNSVAKAALSTQFHLGLDWYATVRKDVGAGQSSLLSDSQGALGAFGLWNLGEGTSVTTRTELLARLDSPRTTLRSYHDLSLGFEGGWSATTRWLYSAGLSDPWSGSGEVRWAVLQNLSVSVTGALKSPWWVQAGCSARW